MSTASPSTHFVAAIVSVALVGAALGLPPGASASAPKASGHVPAPRLGRTWGRSQSGYGTVRPTRVFNGGDPTGLVIHIHWSGWGSGEAIGRGDAEYVWPGTSVASNRLTSGARIVAFHLGTCRGHRAYNAIEWYFPKYGQTFNPNDYIDICSGQYVGGVPTETKCPDVRLPDEAGMATEVNVVNMTCAAASAIIAEINTTRFGSSESRFVQSGFRCGTEGTAGGLQNAIFDCQVGEQEFLFGAKS
jgi:hypothetical protein